MHRRDFLRSTTIGGSLFLNSHLLGKEHSSARSLSKFDFDWKFYLGDLKGAESPEVEDEGWRTLDLPHDWSIEGEYAPDHGTDWQSGYLPAGIGWYRKSFAWNDEWVGRSVKVYFEGIYLNSDVWINGQHLGNQPNGYIGFEYDLTRHLKHGNNVIAVRVDHSKPLTGRWYTGSGIYRHVWLKTTPKIFIDEWETFFTTPDVDKNQVEFHLATELVNTTAERVKGVLETSLADAHGEVVATRRAEMRMESGQRKRLSQTGFVKSPLLWSVEKPNLYSLRLELKIDGYFRDLYETRVGLRKIEYGSEFGFKLNNVVTKMKGVCDHHTAGPVGAAIPEDVLSHRLRLLKEMGCNAIRTAHNPFAPSFYRICDELGFLVMNEALDGWEEAKAEHDYGNYFEEHWRADLTRFVKRDRNHPSVVIWSIGNEVRKPSRETQRQLIDLFHTLDPTRPVTQGGHDPTRGMEGEQQETQLDVKGFNGDGEEKGVLEQFHREHPNTPMICTEVPHSYQTRGVYRSRTHWRRVNFPAPWEIRAGTAGVMGKLEGRVFPIPDLTKDEIFPEELTTKYFHDREEKPIEIVETWQPTLYYQSSYDNASVRISARHAWQRIRDLKYLAGHFRWTAFDYLGETNKWPSRFANFGVIDLCGFPKDHFYLYQSMWTEHPMVHLLPHWTHPGKEGTRIPVVVYTNCGEVDLILNGQSLGLKAYQDEQLVWLVPYQAGTLEAVGFKDGKPVARDRRKTARKASAVQLTADRPAIKADRISVVRVETDVVDGDAVMVPLADNLIHFRVSGPARLIGVENGDPLDLSPHKVSWRRAFRGKCIALIQSTGQSGTISVSAESEGVQSDEIRIPAT